MHGKTIFLAAVLAVSSLYAQQPLRVDVPFDFAANSAHWRAGAYEIAFPIPSVILIRNLDNKQVMMVQTVGMESIAKTDAAKVVFNRYGDSYFLSQVWRSSTGRALIQSIAERELAARYPVVTIAALAKRVKK